MIEAYPKEATDLIDQLRGSLVNIRQSAKAGTLNNNEVVLAISELIGDDEDDDQPQAVAAERRRQLTMALEEPNGGTTETLKEPAIVQELTTDGLPVPGGGLSAEDQLVAQVTAGRAPQGGLSPAAQRMLAQAQGSAGLTIGGEPIPEESLSLEELRNAAIIGRSVPRSSAFSGETVIGGAPVPL
jgi:hypothetical protein